MLVPVHLMVEINSQIHIGCFPLPKYAVVTDIIIGSQYSFLILPLMEPESS